MEFQITRIAKRNSLILLCVGLLLTLIGVLTGYKDHHFSTRLLTNGLIDTFYFFAMGLGALFFLALAYATETGWYAAVKKVIEAVAGFIPYGIGLMGFVLLVITILDGAHIYSWMDPETIAHDPIIQGKTAYLNPTFFWIRTITYFAVYIIFLRGYQKRSIAEDKLGGTDFHFQNYKKGAMFLVYFAVFSSTSSWDWLMSIDVHWFSTLFGWYTFAGMWCTTMVVLIMVTLYLKKHGYLEKVNDHHIHDLGKWTFATSFLWSYLWFSQFMLIWYSNIPEEVIYFTERIANYKLLFFGTFIVNFFFPMVFLMSADTKKSAGYLIVIGLLIFIGHWLDVFNMVMPGTLFDQWEFGLLEIGMFMMFLGSFVFTVLRAISKSPLLQKNHPYLNESKHHEF